MLNKIIISFFQWFFKKKTNERGAINGMAKILLIKAKREEKTGHTHYVYPPEYDAKKIQVLCYENPDEHKARNDGKQHLIGVVSDADAPQFLKSNDIEEISKTKAIPKGRRWRPQVEKIANQRKVLKLVAKQMRGEKLTQKEKDALNPDKPEIGINKSKKFDDLLKEYQQKL